MVKQHALGMVGGTRRRGRPGSVLVAGAGVCALLVAAQGAPAVTASTGTTWQVVASPNPGTGGDRLVSVSCLSSTDCFAAGVANGAGLVEHFNGSTWTPATAITPPTGSKSVGLQGISCTSDTACTVVGYWYNTFNDALALAEFYNGSTWTVENLPAISTTGAEFFSVACTSGGTCTAVGDYYDSGFNAYVVLAMQLDGANGTQDNTNALDLGSNYSIPVSLTCVTASDCTATGSYSSPGSQDSLIGHWNGSSWAAVAGVNPGGTDNDLSGVTCVTGTDCTAVGAYFTFGTGGGLLVEHWDGSSWTQVTTVPASSGSLASISCPSSGSCTAVGSVGSGSSTSLIVQESGGSWTQASSPNPASYADALASVSCAATCMAVGSQAWSNAGPTLTLAETTNAGPFAPGVNGVNPAQGTTAGGTPVTITGAGFTGATAVKFGATAVSHFTVVSDSEITTTSPRGVAGVAEVTVTTPAGTSAVGYPDDQFDFIPKPSIKKVAPSSGTTAGGTKVTVAGAHFSGATAVHLGTVSIGAFTVVSDTQITFLTPAQSAGPQDVTVTTPEGTSKVVAGDVFTYSAAAVTVTTTSLPAGSQGVRYPPTTLQASGGTTPYRWMLAPGSTLPSLMRLSGGGVLSGTPQCAGTYQFVVVVTDSTHGNDQRQLTLTVSGPGCG